jgi:predicted nucleic acid-binding Zn ribbon protein
MIVCTWCNEWWCSIFGEVAQLVEQSAEHACVGGSNPSLTTIYMTRISKEIEQQIIDLYQNDVSAVSICEQLPVSRKSIYRILEKNDIEVKRMIDEVGVTCECCNNDFKQLQGRNRTRCNGCNTQIRRLRLKKKAVEYKGGGCSRCGLISDNLSVYDFHHTDPTQKEFHLTGSNMAIKSWDEIVAELDKCDLVCSNCHRIEHSNQERFLKYL